MDTLCREARSRNMAAIRSRGNRSTERALRARLIQAGIRGWRVCAQDIEGCPDFVFDAHRFTIFVDGCFWHGCPKCHRPPSSNTDYWTAKLARNRKRDRRVTETLRTSGWRVLRIWEHELELTPARALSKVWRKIKATAGTSARANAAP